MAPPMFSKSSDVLFKNFRSFAVGKDEGLEFNWKIFELGVPTLQVTRRPCSS